MTDSGRQEKAIQALVAINAAIRNIHLYPISSASAIVSIDKAYYTVQEAIGKRKNDILVFAESEKRLLIGEKPLGDGEQKKPQISAFLGLLLNLGIRTITIRRGVERKEFCAFLEAVSSEAKNIGKGSDLKKTLSARDLPHISLDHKVYVSQDQKTNHNDENGGDVGKNFGAMVHTLDRILTSDTKKDVSRHMAASLVHRDEQLLTTVFTQKVQGELGQQLFNHLVNEMNDQQFERLIFRMKQMYEAAKPDAGNSGISESKALQETLRNLIRTDKGIQLQARIRKKRVREKEKKKKQTARLLTGIGNILSEHPDAFRDEELMKQLPEMIGSLVIQGRKEMAEKVIDRLGDGLFSKDLQIRAHVSEALCNIIEKAMPEERNHLVRRLSYNLADWLRLETTVNPTYQKLCTYLKDLACDLIRSRRLAEANHILETLNAICYEKTPRFRSRQRLICATLRQIASDDVMSQALAELGAEEPERRKQGLHTLKQVGAGAVPALLSMLKESQERYERARMIRIISAIGEPALPAMTEHLRSGGPWYYMRNLILLFGRVGNASHLELLRPFLEHEDQRVRGECLDTILTIGGDQREAFLLAALPSVGDLLKLDIIRLLGKMKSRKALPLLLHLIDPEKFIQSKMNTRLAEHVCEALGKIGSPKAAPILKRIVDQKKGQRRRNSDDKKLLAAAENALIMIWQAQLVTGKKTVPQPKASS